MPDNWKRLLTLLSAMALIAFTPIPVFADDSDVGDAERIIGTDDRVRITKTTTTPYAQTVKIYSFFGNMSATASGVMISPDTVLTAAHALYDATTNTIATSVTVVPGLNGNYKPFGSASSNTFYFFDEYLNSKSSSYDIAAITLSSPLKSAGYLPVSTNSSVGERVQLVGYPGEKPTSQYSMYNTITGKRGAHLTYQIDSTPGQSGSPILNQKNQVVGIHIAGGVGDFNVARAIDNNAMNLVRASTSHAPSGNGIVGVVNTYRLYHPSAQRHLYTADVAERDALIGTGWRYEGVAWRTSVSGRPVYRLYNSSLQRHLYTADTNEKNVLSRQGWRYEGIAWYSSGSLQIYRLYNESLKQHLYTLDANEVRVLTQRGWRNEGIAWYAIKK